MKVDYFHLLDVCISALVAEIGCDTRFGQGWIRTAKAVEPADFLYASIQSGAISRWAVFQIQLAGAYEIVKLPLKRIFHIGVPGRRFG
jgi:hypothetical protein